MKPLFLIVFLFWGLLATPQADELSSTKQVIWDIAKGFVLGLHIDRISPVDEECIQDVKYLIEEFKDTFEKKKKGESTYDFIDEFTYTIGIIPSSVRECVQVPMASWESLKNFWAKFNNSVTVYFEAVGLNIGWHADDLTYYYFNITADFEKKDFYDAAYLIGDALNMIFNVSSANPIPKDNQVMMIREKENLQSHEEVREEVKLMFKDNFEKWLTYIMTVLNYTRLANSTTWDNLNASLYMIEYDIIEGIAYFKEGEVLEGILSFVDLLSTINPLINGFYYVFKQLPGNLFKKNIFVHIKAVPENLLIHIGYYIWDTIKILQDTKDGNTLDLCKRIGDLINKVLFLDEDVLDGI